MVAVVQRVTNASVTLFADKKESHQIGIGYCVLLGVAADDTESDVQKVANKIAKLRIFSDEHGKMNLNLFDVKGSILLVSQFTLLANLTDGNRPSFIKAAPPELADSHYQNMAAKLSSLGIDVKTGYFGKHMTVSIENDGPVTIIIDSKKL